MAITPRWLVFQLRVSYILAPRMTSVAQGCLRLIALMAMLLFSSRMHSALRRKPKRASEFLNMLLEMLFQSRPGRLCVLHGPSSQVGLHPSVLVLELQADQALVNRVDGTRPVSHDASS